MNKIVAVESLSNLQKMLMLEVGEVGALKLNFYFLNPQELTLLRELVAIDVEFLSGKRT